MHPTIEEVKDLYDLYKETFAFDDGGSIDDYFRRNFKQEYCYILKENEQIVGMLCAHPHKMHLQGASLPVRFISGVIIREAYRKQGKMKALFELLMQDSGATTALYVLQAYHPELYTSMGFEQRYFIQWKTSSHAEQDHLHLVTSAQMLCDVAQQELLHADGYLEHDVAFYENQLLEAQTVHQSYLGIYEQGTLISFARCNNNDCQVRLEEYKGINEQAKQTLLAQCHSRFGEVQYPISCSELEPRKECNLMVKLGNPALCSSIFGRTITSLDDIYQKNQPYLHDGWW